MKLINTKIRKVRGRNDFKISLKYQKSNGVEVTSIVIKPSRIAAQNYLKFRTAGLRNGGKVSNNAA